MQKRKVVGVIGAFNATDDQKIMAEAAGRAIAEKGWIMVSGGLAGVMEAASKGAAEEGGLVVGILPTPTKEPGNEYLGIAIATNMGHARNVIIVHTADALLAIGGEEGTLSEIATALKLKKPVAALKSWEIPGVHKVDSVDDAIRWIEGKL